MNAKRSKKAEEKVSSSKAHLSFAGRVTAGYIGTLFLMGAMAGVSIELGLPSGLTIVLILLVGVPVGTWFIGRVTRPLTHTLGGIRDALASFGDRDFSMRLTTKRTDELGDIARSLNAVSKILEEERREIRQKELLLSTALDRSPAAIVLVNDQDWIVYANKESRHLLVGGAKLAGCRFSDILNCCPRKMQTVLAGESDGMFTVVHNDNSENYHLAKRVFLLNRREHQLIVLQRITRELNRQEAEAWKKVIRIVCHELNNSFAPILSLVHSASTILNRPDQSERIEEIFEIIQERLIHLKEFIEGYAHFARLPKPRKEPIHFESLFSCLAQFPSVKAPQNLPSKRINVDPAQMRQLLVNLLLNAKEASHDSSEISVEVYSAPQGGFTIQVFDRGVGMDDSTMKKAILPFYSTKKEGSGLGLPLCREIIEAHGGHIGFQSREGGGTVVTCWLP
ncbi:MAG: HAMP domain-containing protein [Proteobacteria bacterium]|nr:HAMP domain-containing protein [Pseudomonadota bacterium]